MIRHIVLVRFRADVPPAEIEDIAAGLRALVGHLDGFVACHGGPDLNFEGMDRGYRHGFVLDFVDQAARLRYHHADEHQPISARLVAAAEGGRDGILVVDLEFD
jgi:hypothetical protein